MQKYAKVCKVTQFYAKFRKVLQSYVTYLSLLRWSHALRSDQLVSEQFSGPHVPVVKNLFLTRVPL